MNENEEIQYERDEDLSSSTADPGSETPRRRKIHPAILAAGGVTAAGVLLLLVWFFAWRDPESGRPVPAPRNVGVGENRPGAVAGGEMVTVTQEQQQASGFQIETIGEQLAAEVGLTAATGVVEPDAYRNTPVFPLVGGIVRSIRPELGENVARGATVAVIFSNEFAETQSQYVAQLTRVRNARANYERTQRLVRINQPGRTEFDAASRQLKAAEASLSEMQNRFQRTNRLLAIGAASREDLEQDTTKLRTAEAEVAEARNRVSRATQLLEINPETRAQNEAALNDLRTAEGDLAAVRQRLVLYGMSEGRIAALQTPSQVTSEMSVPAPISGTVTSRTVNPGEVVEPNKELLRITDLSSVWVIAQAFEADLPRLRVGSGASVTVNAYPERLFRGQVTYIDPSIDPTTRTAQVRIELANPDRLLKWGMYVNVAFGSLGQSERTVPMVKAEAVQDIAGDKVIFLATDDPNQFELRRVRLGEEVNGRYPILEGAFVGDRVVTNGSFMLRAEWLKLNQ